MLRRTAICQNTQLTWSKATPPSRIIKNTEWFDDPERLYRYKLMYFALGLDQLPLRRAAVLAAEAERVQRAELDNKLMIKKNDLTGFTLAQRRQMMTWHNRMKYQEWYLEHLHMRHVWAMLRKYPTGGAKIAGVAEQPYFGYDYNVNRFTRERNPANARELYPRRRL